MRSGDIYAPGSVGGTTIGYFWAINTEDAPNFNVSGRLFFNRDLCYASALWQRYVGYPLRCLVR